MKKRQNGASWTGFCQMPFWPVSLLLENLLRRGILWGKITSCTQLALWFTSVSPAISTEVSHLSTKHGPSCDCKPPPSFRAWKICVVVTWIQATPSYKKRDRISTFKTKPPPNGWYPSDFLTRNLLWFLRLLYHTSNDLHIKPHICTGTMNSMNFIFPCTSEFATFVWPLSAPAGWVR